MSLEVNRNILIAVDESENARRAVAYVAKLLGGIGGFKVTVFHVISNPEEDFFEDQSHREQWLSAYFKRVEQMLKEYSDILVDAGFDGQDVSIRSTIRYCPSMAECILAEMDINSYSTIVVGRRGVNHKEEFLFGSISGKIVRTARNCAVWVVE